MNRSDSQVLLFDILPLFHKASNNDLNTLQSDYYCFNKILMD